MRIRLSAVVALAMTMLGAGVAAAQPMAEMVPSEAVVYAGWRGGRELPARAKGTKFEAVLSATNMPERVKDAFKHGVALGLKDRPKATQMADLVGALGEAAWEHPFAFYVAPDASMAQAGLDIVEFGYVIRWRTGSRKEGLMLWGKIHKILERMSEGVELEASSPFVQIVENDVVLSAGHIQLKVAAETPKQSLKDDARFKKTFAVVGEDAKSEMAFYVDAKSGLALIYRDIDKSIISDFRAYWPKLREAISLEGVHAIVWSAGFDGQDWSTRMFIDAPAPRKGLVSLLEAPAISKETLRLAPNGAVWMNAFNFDAAQIVEQVQQIAETVVPGTAPIFANALESSKRSTGVHVRQLIQSIGPEWVAYSDPELGGSVSLSLIVANRLRDTEMFKAQMTALKAYVNQIAAGSKMGFKLRIDSVKHGELEIYTLKLPLRSPSWVVSEQTLYMGLTPEVVEAAAKDSRKGGSILENPAYAEVTKKLGNKEFTWVSYADLRKTAEESHATLSLAMQAAGGRMVQQGGENPLGALVPALETVAPYLAPAGRAGWSDANGFYYASTSPFPGANVLGSDLQVRVSPAALAVGITLPGVAAAWNTVNQIRSNSRLRRIHLNMAMYSFEKGVYPSSAGTMMEDMYLDKHAFIAPGSEVQFPRGFGKLTMEQKTKWLEENGSYVMLRWGQKANRDPQMIMGYLKPSHFPGNGISVVFADNRGAWMPKDEVLKLLKEQYPDHKPQGF